MMSFKIGFLLIVGFCTNVRSNDYADDLEPTMLKSSVSGNGGGTYVRWGRTVCPDNAQLVYTGYAGGSRCSPQGGTSNYLCLPDNPEMSDETIHETEKHALLYGAEYEFGLLHDQDVPCIVCESARPNILMIPARNTCFAGWTLEYVGHLSAGYVGDTGGSEYVCLDGEPESRPGSLANTNGKLFYRTAATCVSLVCPPYAEKKSVPCVVCSK